MTQLDEFTIDFKTKATAQTRAEIAAIDKQLTEMDKKGKKRTDEENKQYLELKKRRKELLEETKTQTRETEKLADSFANVAQNILGAVTAFATFGALKAGILDAAKLNANIYLQSKVTGQAEDDLRAYGAAVASFGGDAESFVQAQDAMAKKAAESGITYKNVGAFLNSMHDSIEGISSLAEKRRVLGLAGISDLPLVGLLEDQNYYKIIGRHRELSQASEEDYKKAFDFLQISQDFGSALSNVYTRLGSDIFPTVTNALNDINDDLKDLEKEQFGIESFFSKIAVAATLAVTPLRAFGAALLVASEIGAAEHDALNPNEPRQSFLAKQIDKAILGESNPSVTPTLSQSVQLTGTEGNKDFDGDDYLTQIDNARKGKVARQIATNYSPSLFSGYGLGDTNTQNQSFKIDNVTINTQATDASGIASAFKEAFNREYHTAFSDIDDAQNR